MGLMGLSVTPSDCPDFDPNSRYERLSGDDVLGAGTYGEVYKVRCRKTGRKFALKRMKVQDQDEGVPSTAIREVSILKELPHPNIIKLHDIFCSPNKVNLIFELADFDLKRFMSSKYVPSGTLSFDMLQDFTHQLCTGVEFCHRNRIIHRDLKPQNVLVNVDPNGTKHVLQIADFGLARTFTLPFPRLTHEVVTVWYRAPEILMGCELYCIGVDMWSIGCIFAELACGVPLFMGDCEIGTLFKIFQKCGTPDETNWPGVKELAAWSPAFPKWKKVSWWDCRNIGKSLEAAGCDMLDKLLIYSPSMRISCRGCLNHAFFRDWRQKNGFDAKVATTPEEMKVPLRENMVIAEQ